MKKYFSLLLVGVIIVLIICLIIYIFSKDQETELQNNIQSPVASSSLDNVSSLSTIESSSSDSTTTLPNVHEISSKYLMISFLEELYSNPKESFDNTYPTVTVQNFVPNDSGNGSPGMTSSQDWRITIEDNYVYNPDTKTGCVSTIEKILIDGRELKLCKGGGDNDLSGINAFIFDNSSKTGIFILAATEEAKIEALSEITNGAKWK